MLLSSQIHSYFNTNSHEQHVHVSLKTQTRGLCLIVFNRVPRVVQHPQGQIFVSPLSAHDMKRHKPSITHNLPEIIVVGYR